MNEWWITNSIFTIEFKNQIQKTKKKRPTTVVYSTGRFDYLINTSLHVQVKKAIFFFFSEKKYWNFFFAEWIYVANDMIHNHELTDYWLKTSCLSSAREERERERDLKLDRL